MAFHNWSVDDCKTPITDVLKRQLTYRTIISKLQAQFSQLVIVDSLEEFCDKNECHANDSNGSWYHDDNHVSTNGSKKLLNFIFKKIN